jgi:hypothetical protein
MGRVVRKQLISLILLLLLCGNHRASAFDYSDYIIPFPTTVSQEESSYTAQRAWYWSRTQLGLGAFASPWLQRVPISAIGYGYQFGQASFSLETNVQSIDSTPAFAPACATRCDATSPWSAAIGARVQYATAGLSVYGSGGLRYNNNWQYYGIAATRPFESNTQWFVSGGLNLPISSNSSAWVGVTHFNRISYGCAASCGGAFLTNDKFAATVFQAGLTIKFGDLPSSKSESWLMPLTPTPVPKPKPAPPEQPVPNVP